MSQILKIAWVERVDILNRRPIPGRYIAIHIEVGEGDGLLMNVLWSLSTDWSNMVRLLRRCITRKPKGIDSQVVCCFGDERVRLGSQSFRKFNLPYLLRLSLFGEEYSNLHDNELVKKTVRCIVLHIASMRRVKKLLTVENECGVSFLENNRTLSCCGKVNMTNRNGGNMLGYIIDETKLAFKI